MKTFYILLISLMPLIGISQTSSEALNKIKTMKGLLEMELISKEEFDSISKILKDIILNEYAKKDNTINEYDGFYYRNKLMYPEKFSESNTDVLGSVLTYGIAGGSTKSILKGLSSKTKVDSVQQFKLIIFENTDLVGNKMSNIQNQQFFSSIQSPQDFALVKLSIDKTNRSRWIKTGSMNLTDGYSFSIKAKEYIDFEWETSKNKGEFIINTKLGSGEYAFIFVGTSAYTNNSIYTFSIKSGVKATKNNNSNSKKPKRTHYKSSTAYKKALKKYENEIQQQQE